MKFVRKYRYEIALVCVLAIATILRFYRLGSHSLWYDELYTANEADPSLPWKQLFYYSQTDQHPPFYFILQRLAFTWLGYTDWVARSVAALSGVLCIPAIYRLGKELLDKRLGLIAAVIVSVNQYAIRYSQEARPYMPAVLLTILSYLFFIKAVKRLRPVDALWYAFFSILLIYTSYFGFLVLLSQGILAIILWINTKKAKKAFFITMFSACLLILTGYLPWYKYLLKQSGLKPFWLGKEPSDFLLTYYYSYFGGERLLLPFLIIAPLLWLLSLFKQRGARMALRERPYMLGLLFILVSVSVPILTLYIRSELYSPVLQQRYAMIAVPGLYMMVAWGLYSIKRRIISDVVVVLFGLIAIYNVVYRHHFYSFPLEMQYKQAAAYMAETNKEFPVVNKLNGWQMKYYMKANNYTGKIIRTDKYKALDHILSGREPYAFDTFWVVTGFLDEPLRPAMRAYVDTSFTVVRKQEFNTISVELFGRKGN